MPIPHAGPDSRISAWVRRHGPWIGASLLGLSLAWIARGGQIYLGHDEFRYVQIARNIFHGDTSGLTTLWAWGFPATAMPFMLLGAHPATGLVIVSALSMVLLLYTADRMLLERSVPVILRLGCGFAIAVIPIWSELQFKPLSDALFSAGVILLFRYMAREKGGPSAARIALVTTLLMLVHYTGFVFLPALPVWMFLRRPRPAGRSFRPALAWFTVPVSAAAAYLLFIQYNSGNPAGEHMLDADWRIPLFSAQYGLNYLGVLSVYIQGALPDAARLVAGNVITVGLLAGAIACVWFRRGDPLLLAAAILVLLFSLGLIGMRCASFFYLEQVRRAMPLLPVLLVVAAAALPRVPVGLRYALFIPLVVVGVVQGIRASASVDPMLPVRHAERYLAGTVLPGEKVFVNYAGKSIFRSVNADVEFLFGENDSARAIATADVFVILAERTPGSRSRYAFETEWRRVHETGTLEHAPFACIKKTGDFIVFRRAQRR